MTRSVCYYHFGRKCKDRSSRNLNSKRSLKFGPDRSPCTYRLQRVVRRELEITWHDVALLFGRWERGRPAVLTPAPRAWIARRLFLVAYFGAVYVCGVRIDARVLVRHDWLVACPASAD